ncbi:MAG: TRAP transporter large permease, partial [candidate division NC10 bacterium]|nr:TRAP transporter large permease [candidate division NC10 bacterium]
TRAEIWQAFKDSIWGLMAPLVILGGIYGGIFTPTEAAVVAVFYGLFVGAVVHRNLTWTILYSTLRDAALSSAVVMVIVAFAGLFAWAGSTLGAMDKAAAFIISLSGSPWVTILWVNLLLFIAGMLLDAVSIYYVFLPIFLPVMAHFHWDPIWFGVVMTVNLAIGQVTPPVAVNLYVAANLARISLETISRAVVPFVLAMLGALLVIIYLPFLSTWLPKLLRLY